MHDVDLILTPTGGLAAALVCGYAALLLGLSPIVGYLLAGFLVGPNTPGFLVDRRAIRISPSFLYCSPGVSPGGCF
jgi:CPA2 family monovalent cation:H+ antiporter-2